MFTKNIFTQTDPVADLIKGINETDYENKRSALTAANLFRVVEGWDDMLKDVKDKAGPQPSGGSGVKQGSSYGGSKQKDKPEQEVDKKKKMKKEEIDPKDTETDTLKGREKTSKNPFLSKKVMMDVPGNVKEEDEELDEGLGHFVVKQMSRLANKSDLQDHHINVAQKKVNSDLGTGHPQADNILNKHKKLARDAQYHKKSDDEARQHFADNMQTLHNDLKSARSVKEDVEELDEASFDPLKHVKNPSPAVKTAAKDVKRGSYADRAALMKAGGVKDDRGPRGVTQEEVEILDEGKMDKSSLSSLWHKHAQHSYFADQGYGIGSVSMNHNSAAATAIENHVRKHHGNKVADDMVDHSEHHVSHAEYAGPKDSEYHEKEMSKLRKKHKIDDPSLHEETQLDERSLSPAEKDAVEVNVKAMKKNLAGFKARYGKDAKSVMYATSTKQAKKD